MQKEDLDMEERTDFSLTVCKKTPLMLVPVKFLQWLLEDNTISKRHIGTCKFILLIWSEIAQRMEEQNMEEEAGHAVAKNIFFIIILHCVNNDKTVNGELPLLSCNTRLSHSRLYKFLQG